MLHVDQDVTMFVPYWGTLSERSVGLTLGSYGDVLPSLLPLMVLWGFPWGLPWGLGLFLVSGELMQEANRHMSSSPGAGGSRYLSRPSPTGGSEARMCGWAWGSLTSMCTACP